MQQSDPRSIIDRYCEITGLGSATHVPYQASFSRMISVIVDFEFRPHSDMGDSFGSASDKGVPVLSPMPSQQPAP
jgi:hypothetical protein